VQQRQLDGLVLLAMLDESHSDSLYAQPPEVPMVAIEPSVKTPLPSVCWDASWAVDEVVGHLAALGHKQMLWLGPEPIHGTTPPAKREMLFMQKMWDRGLKGHSCRYTRDEPHGSTSVGETYLDPARDALARYLDEPKRPDFTAIVCFNDTTALGAMASLRSRNRRIPEDISVTGFDDTEAVFAVPKLTTIRLPLEQMGSRAFELLLEQIEDPTRIQAMRGFRELLRGEMVVRESTASPRR
jgi:LacI family transcriptional regulator